MYINSELLEYFVTCSYIWFSEYMLKIYNKNEHFILISVLRFISWKHLRLYGLLHTVPNCTGPQAPKLMTFIWVNAMSFQNFPTIYHIELSPTEPSTPLSSWQQHEDKILALALQAAMISLRLPWYAERTAPPNFWNTIILSFKSFLYFTFAMVFTNLFHLVLIRNYKLYFIVPLCSFSFSLTITAFLCLYPDTHTLETSWDLEIMPIWITEMCSGPYCSIEFRRHGRVSSHIINLH